MGLLSDIPDRCKVRRVIDYDEDGNAVGSHWVQADSAFVGFALVQGTRRKFWIAADDVFGDDNFFALPEGTDPGPEIGVLCKISRDGSFRCGGYDEDAETPREGMRKHGIRICRALLVKWYLAGVLRNPQV